MEIIKKIKSVVVKVIISPWFDLAPVVGFLGAYGIKKGENWIAGSCIILWLFVLMVRYSKGYYKK